jgi:hypothetical protein
MSTGINIAPSSDITVGTTASTGVNGRVFFQAGGVIQQDANFTYDNTLKRLELKAVGTAATDIPFIVQNSAGTINNFYINGLGEGYFKSQQAQPYGITIENIQTSSSSENTLGSRLTLVSSGTNPGDRAYLHYHNSNGGGSNAGTFIISSPRGFRFDSPGTYVSDNYRWGTTTAANHMALQAVSAGNILRLNVAGGGSTSSEIQIANALSNYSWWKAPNNDANHAMSWGRTATEYMRLNQSGFLGIGAISPGARLDVRAQGALSTDIAFRVRNSADTQNLYYQDGTGTFIFRNNAGNKFIYWDGSNTLQLGTSGGQTLNINTESTAVTRITTTSDLLYSGVSTHVFLQYKNGNFQLEQTSGIAQTSGEGGLSLKNGTAPTVSSADRFIQYSADITAGNAAPHFRTENGAIVKVYQETTAVVAAAFVSNTSLIVDDSATYGGYTMGQVVAALKAQGLLA